MRRCWAILFLDLSKAFDTVFRELALGPRDVPPTELATTLRSRGVPPEVADAIVEFLDTKGPRILAGGLEPAAAQAIADWHAATWSHVRPLDGQPPTPVSDSVPVASSTTGARQGDRLGAIVFNIIYDIMLSEVRERLQALGISTTMWVAPDAVPWHTNVNTTEEPGPVVVDQATYVDDLAQMLEAETPALLLEHLTTVVNILHEVLSRYGLRINFGPDKTTIMLRLFGPGARKAYASIRDEDGGLGLDTAAGRCKIVHHYKHVGTILQTSGRSLLDAHAKAAKMQKTYGPMAHTVFGATVINQETRASLVRSLLDSRLLYGAELWLQPDPVARRRTQEAYIRPRRRILGHPRFEHTDVTDQRVCEMLGHPALDMALTMRRLNLLYTLLRGPSFVRAIHCQEPKPPQAYTFLEDMVLVWQHSTLVGDLPHPAEAPGQWREFIIASKRRWRQAVRDIAQLPNRTGIIAQLEAPPEAPTGDCIATPRDKEVLQCDRCQRWCRSWRGLAAHRLKAHGITAEARHFCISDICPACGKSYFTRPRAIHHLQYSSRSCRQKMLDGSLPRFTDREVEAADAADRELVRADVLAGRGRHVARRAPKANV